MKCQEICNSPLSEKLFTSSVDRQHLLLESLSRDSSELTKICDRVLRGGVDHESSLTTVALRLHMTLGAIRSEATCQKGDARFKTAVAREVENALGRICDLEKLIHQTGDDRLSCLHPVVDVGESLNSLYDEVGHAIVA
jgi:hypothetical protein